MLHYWHTSSITTSILHYWHTSSITTGMLHYWHTLGTVCKPLAQPPVLHEFALDCTALAVSNLIQSNATGKASVGTIAKHTVGQLIHLFTLKREEAIQRGAYLGLNCPVMQCIATNAMEMSPAERNSALFGRNTVEMYQKCSENAMKIQ